MVRKWKKGEVFTKFKRKVLGERKRFEKEALEEVGVAYR